ncbi:MAG: glycosyltransferase, partial [Myxococcota bacterium]
GIAAEVIPHGLPPERYPLGRGEGGYAAFVGRFSREKGVADALDAAHAAKVPIQLGGRAHPMDADYYRDQVAPRLERPGVRWFGEVGHEGKVRILGNAAATLFPIAWEEPFGLVMVESMLCGTPVVAYPHGSVPEVVEEGVTGFFVEDTKGMADRLNELVSGRLRFDRKRCRAAAVARFGVERMVSGYLGLYSATIARRLPRVEAR